MNLLKTNESCYFVKSKAGSVSSSDVSKKKKNTIVLKPLFDCI